MRSRTLDRVTVSFITLCFILSCYPLAFSITISDLSSAIESGPAERSSLTGPGPLQHLGRIVYQSKVSGSNDIWIMDSDGTNQTQLILWPSFDGGPSWSPDGKKIAFDSYYGGGGLNIWVMEADGSNLTQLTTDPASDGCGDWSPDGRIVFQSERTGTWQLWVMNSDGSNQTQLLSTPMSHHHPTWSPDGKKIAFDSGFYIWVVDADGSNLTQLTPHHGAYPAWSPDGSKIAYSHHEGTKGSDIWVMNSDGSSQRSLTDSSENDEFPGWSPDGKRIAYGRGNWPNWNESNIWVVDLSGNAVQLTSNPALEADPDWAYQPDANDTVKPLAPDLEKAILAGADSENVEISWYRSADELEPGGTIRYEIWRSQSLAGTYTRLGEVPAYGSSLYSYLDAGAGNGDSNDYFYKVHSVDISGNRNESAQISGKFTRALEMGPNLISIPLVQWDEKIEVVLQTPSWNKAWIYDASIGKWKWHMKFKPYLGELREINHELGVWINITEPSNLTVAGIVPIATNILLRDGWNLVAFPSFNSSYSVSDLKVAAPVKRIESFDSSAPPYSLRVLTDVDYLQSGAGYWIKAGVQTVWIVGNS